MTLRVVADNTVELPVDNCQDLAGMIRKFADLIEARDDVVRIVILTDTNSGLDLEYWGESLSGYAMIGLLDTAKDIAKRDHDED